MATVTFDTITARKNLREANFSEQQADTILQVLADAQAEVVTRDHLEVTLAAIRTDLAVLKWGVGVNAVMTIAILVKQYF